MIGYCPGCNPTNIEGAGNYRYGLSKAGSNPLIVIGMNPSLATMDYADLTVRKISKVAMECTYDGWVMLNVHPVYSTNPRDVELTNDNLDELQNNLNYIRECLNRFPDAPVFVAWGKNNGVPILDLGRKMVNDLLKEMERECYAFQLNNDNSPTHPSRLPYKIMIGAAKNKNCIYELQGSKSDY